MYSENMKFVETHEWVKVEKDDVVIVGITDHAQQLLGDIVYVELPSIGETIKAHATIGVVESVKAASDLYSPVTGQVVAVNENVTTEPTLLNSDPHDKGWLFKVKLTDVAELDNLMSVNQYTSLIKA